MSLYNQQSKGYFPLPNVVISQILMVLSSGADATSSRTPRQRLYWHGPECVARIPHRDIPEPDSGIDSGGRHQFPVLQKWYIKDPIGMALERAEGDES
jgi:hypothetical protein